MDLLRTVMRVESDMVLNHRNPITLVRVIRSSFITGSNKYGSVSTTLIMTLGINTPPAEGVTVCAVPVPATFLGIDSS